MTRLSEHFTLEEFTRSQTAARLGIDNSPSEVHLQNLFLVAQTLEIVRVRFGAVHVSSGYRSAALNAAVPGSSKTSAHCKGLAADFTIPGTPNIEVCRWIEKQIHHFDQVIYEFGPAPGGWVHLGLAMGQPRKQSLTAYKQDGATRYEPGIVERWS